MHAAEGRRPNVVFFLVDDLGWRDVACYGSRFYETPNIDSFARDGVRFTQAYAACHVCSPTRASILTGKYPARLKLTDWINGERCKRTATGILSSVTCHAVRLAGGGLCFSDAQYSMSVVESNQRDVSSTRGQVCRAMGNFENL